MKNNIEHPSDPRNTRALAGLILLGIGAILLLNQFNFFFFAHNLTVWPLWMIFGGFALGARNSFNKPGAFILILLGVIFLITENINRSDDFVWPLAIIAVGLWLILRKRSRFDKTQFKSDFKDISDESKTTEGPITDHTTPADFTTSSTLPPKQEYSSKPPTGDDFLDTVSVFGSVKKIILSKDFKGGEIVNIFGGAELDFTQADINGRIIIDITQLFGSTKIIVPSHWQVVSDIAAVFSGIDDKRMRNTAATGSEKVLVLKGVSIFAGVDIRSYY